ncbi:MAG TPA: BMP family ABC transporter substrate-binding protein [Lachnospiraceae bacterium]|nr:BMP family ABC transporter substrate-binding protein [Lachnospiraceae bacterium]
MKNKELRTRILFLLAGVLVVAGIVLMIINFSPDRINRVVSVGAVFIGEADDNGWNESHYKGIRKACEENGCIMYSRMGVAEQEEELKGAVSVLVSQGCSCIFLTSYGYGEYLNSIAQEYPKVAFYCISGEGDRSNCTSYFARMYQVRYLAGIVAGKATESGILGYVTAMPIPETIRSVNAYALGARKANPSARVIVVYTGSWDDKASEEEAVMSLKEAGADVITYHEDRPYAIDLADEMGMLTTGYDYVSKQYSNRFLTGAVINWDILYTKVLRDYLSGRANFSKGYWLGLSDGAVSLYPYSDMVSEETRELVTSEEERIMTTLDVFSGRILDNTGVERCSENERISDDELFNHIDWYVEGVEVYE